MRASYSLSVDRAVVRERHPVDLARRAAPARATRGRPSETRPRSRATRRRAPSKSQRTRERARRLRHGARDRDLVDVSVDQPRERFAAHARPRRPTRPSPSRRVPRVEVGVGGRARRVRLRRLRAVVHGDRVREERDPRSPARRCRIAGVGAVTALGRGGDGTRNVAALWVEAEEPWHPAELRTERSCLSSAQRCTCVHRMEGEISADAR